MMPKMCTWPTMRRSTSMAHGMARSARASVSRSRTNWRNETGVRDSEPGGRVGSHGCT